MRLFFSLLVWFFWLTNSSAQTQINTDSLQEQTKELIYTDNLKSTKISDYILQNTEVNDVKYREILTKSENYFLQKKFPLILHQLRNLNHYEIQNPFLELKKQILLAEILDSLDLDSISEEILISSKDLIQKIKESNQRKEAEILIQLLSKDNNNRSLLQLEKEIQNNSFSDKLNILNKIRLKIAGNYLKKAEFDSTFVYYSKIEEIPESYFYFHAKIGKAKILKAKGNIVESNKILLDLIASESKMKDVFLSEIYKTISSNYLEISQLKESSFYMDFYLKFFDNELENKQKARLKILDLVEFEKTKHQSESIDFYKTIIYVAVFIFTLILGFLFYKLLKINQKRRIEAQTQKNTQWLEASKKEMETRMLEEKNVPFVIPEKTEMVILNKLRNFEKNNQFLNPDLSLNSLAKEFNTNTSYLSEIINKHIGKNFKTHVNELRIKYITEKMQSHPEYLTYKISYLAAEAGFTSRTSFTTIFKSVTGVSPSIFIESLQQNNKK